MEEVKMSIEEARTLLAEEDKKNEQACLDEINAVLKKHGYSIEVTKPHIFITKLQR
jgi:hypothetical protein